MKIALMGPPGSGKVRLAKKLAEEFELKAVHGYMGSLQKGTGLALGPFGTYADNIMISGVREAKRLSAGTDYVIAGTIVDTLCYAMIRADVSIRKGLEEQNRMNLIAEAGVQALSFLYTETYDYDLAFFLPYTGTTRKRRAPWEQKLEQVYREVTQAYNVPDVFILEGPQDEKFKTAASLVLDYKQEFDQEGTDEETDE